MNCVQAFTRALGQNSKTDDLDAQMLSLMNTAMTLHQVKILSQTQQELDELQTSRNGLIKNFAAVLNHLMIAISYSLQDFMVEPRRDRCLIDTALQQ